MFAPLREVAYLRVASLVEIERILTRIDGKGYKAYKDLVGSSQRVDVDRLEVKVTIVRVQGDPFAPPSVIRLEAYVRAPRWNRRAPIAVADFIHRSLADVARRISMRGAGEGRSGVIATTTPSPIMIPRSAVEARVSSEGFKTIARIWVGLPSRRRRVLASVAEELLLERAPRAFALALSAIRNNEDRLKRHVNAWLEQEHIRNSLPKLGLVSFIGDGSILPRRCGSCWEPLRDAIPFESPPSMRVEIELPTGRIVSGMGIPRGLTLVTGPAFHGKTTLAEAVSHGVWNHIPGDGRELVVTVEDAFYVESENGRWVSCVDVSPFILSLPGSKDTRCFSTPDASGATSVAASIQEAVEAGSTMIIVDEDSTATNFLRRDYWAEEVTGKRTINPLCEEAVELAANGISLLAVVSGSPEMMAKSKAIVVMDEYRPVDASGYREKSLAMLKAAGYKPSPVPYKKPLERFIAKPLSTEKWKISGWRLELRGPGRCTVYIDLSANRQLSEEQQLHTAVAAATRIASELSRMSAVGQARKISSMLYTWDYSWLGREPGPEVSYVRPNDIMFVLNRLPVVMRHAG